MPVGKGGGEGRRKKKEEGRQGKREPEEERERGRGGGRPPLDIKHIHISPPISWDLILSPVWAGQDECE